jgi:O-antigen/teichoic acid export membrane protein
MYIHGDLTSQVVKLNSVNQKILKNTLLLSGSQIFGRAVGFLYFVFLARSLSVENLGIYSWILGFGYNFYPLADFGIERAILKKLPREIEKSKYYLSRLFLLRLLLAIIFSFFAVLIAFTIGVGNTKILYLLIFSLALLPYNLIQLLATVENAKENSTTYAKATILGPIILSLLGILIIKFNLDLLWLFLAFTIANLIVLAEIFRSNKIEIKMTLKIDFEFWINIIKESWVFALIITLAVFYIRIPLVMTGLLLNDYQTGIYGSASRFVEAGILIPQSLSLALFPLSSKLLIKDRAKLKKIYYKSVFLLFVISFLFGATMFFGGRFIIPIIYGLEYVDAIPVFSLMGILMIFFFINSLPGNIIHNSDKVKKFLPFSFLNFVIALVGCLILIPMLGVVGGVVAMIIGEIFGFVVNNIFAFKILNEKA